MNAGKELLEFGSKCRHRRNRLCSQGAQSPCWSAPCASTHLRGASARLAERGDYNVAAAVSAAECYAVRTLHCFVGIERRSVIDRPRLLAPLATTIPGAATERTDASPSETFCR